MTLHRPPTSIEINEITTTNTRIKLNSVIFHKKIKIIKANQAENGVHSRKRQGSRKGSLPNCLDLYNNSAEKPPAFTAGTSACGALGRPGGSPEATRHTTIKNKYEKAKILKKKRLTGTVINRQTSHPVSTLDLILRDQKNNHRLGLRQ